jgi:putative two-component system response regulator
VPSDLSLMPILVVDDEEANLAVLRSILTRAGYLQVHTLQDPRRAVERFRAVRPDLVVLDYHMPRLDGLGVLDALGPHLPDYLPVLMLTSDERPALREAALDAGVRDFLTKPVRQAEVLARIRNLLEARAFHTRLADEKERLEGLVRDRTRELEMAQLETLARLARVAEFRDDQAGGHVWRVARGAGLLARELGCDEDWSLLLVRAARLHDVGKIAIPDGILMKPGPLTPEELAVVRTHPAVGHRLLDGGRSPLMRMAARIALTHHERWDGGGYPHGLAEEAIPLEGRIVAAMDAFDVMTYDRRHQPAVAPRAAMEELERQAGTQFDPQVVVAARRAFEAGDLPVETPDG